MKKYTALHKALFLITIIIAFSSCDMEEIKQSIIESEIDDYNVIGSIVEINSDGERSITPIKRIETGNKKVSLYDLEDNEITLDNNKQAIIINTNKNQSEAKYIIKLQDDNKNTINYFLAYTIAYIGKTLAIYTNTNIIYWTGDFDISSINIQQMDSLLFK